MMENNLNELNFVVEVDEFDQPIRRIDKLIAHQKGILHRAVSVVAFNSKNEVLLQRRAMDKYHSPGKWANTCCTHPMWNEEPLAASKRCLKKEFDINGEGWTFWKKIKYQENVGRGLSEYEIDYVYLTKTNEIPKPVASEIMEYKFVNIDDLEAELLDNERNFTYWSRLVLENLNLDLIRNL